MAISNATILDQVWLRGTWDYQQTIPLATQSGVAATVNALDNNPQHWNQAISGLLNLVGAVKVKQVDWTNPMAWFKQEGLIQNASTIVEYALDLVRGKAYNPKETNLFKLDPSKVYSAFYTLNRKQHYDVDINVVETRQAFLNEGSLNSFVDAQLNSLRISDEYDELQLFLDVIAEVDADGGIFHRKVDIVDIKRPTAEELQTLSAEIRTGVGDMTVAPSRLYNRAGIATVAKPEDFAIITTPRYKHSQEVYVLADAFHIEKADWDSRIITVPQLPNPNAVALAIEKSWFVAGDQQKTMLNFFNILSQSTKVVLHRREIVTASPFGQAMMFGNFEDDGFPTVEVNLTGITAQVIDNGTEKPTTKFVYGDDYTVVVDAQGSVTPGYPSVKLPKAVTYKIAISGTEPQTSKTYVDNFGQVHVQPDLPAGTVLTITAESAYINPTTGKKPVDEDGNEFSATTTLTIQ